MAWPPPVLPITRTDATVQQGIHAADHNAANLAINDLVAKVTRLDAPVKVLRTANQVAGPAISNGYGERSIMNVAVPAVAIASTILMQAAVWIGCDTGQCTAATFGRSAQGDSRNVGPVISVAANTYLIVPLMFSRSVAAGAAGDFSIIVNVTAVTSGNPYLGADLTYTQYAAT